MAVIAYKWGGIAFDDKSLIKSLHLPLEAQIGAKITFHDEAGDNYQVPAGKVFIVGRVSGLFECKVAEPHIVYIGESDALDDSLTKILYQKPVAANTSLHVSEEILILFAATKYVTADSDNANTVHHPGGMLYGVEIDA